MSLEEISFDLSTLQARQAITQLFFVCGRVLSSRSNVSPAELYLLLGIISHSLKQ